MPWKEVYAAYASGLRLKVKVNTGACTSSIFRVFPAETQKQSSERRGSVEVLTVAVERMEEFAALLHRV